MHFDTELIVNQEFKHIVQKDNAYEAYVLEIMNLSKKLFPGHYTAIAQQSHGEPDFIDENKTPYDAKLAVSATQLYELCGHNNAKVFMSAIEKQNNEVFDSIIYNTTNEIEIVEQMKKQLSKNSTKNKNIVFLFTFPIGTVCASSITSLFTTDMLAVVLGYLEPFAKEREVFGICPTYDNHYEIRKMGLTEPEFVPYTGLDKYFKWRIKRIVN